MRTGILLRLKSAVAPRGARPRRIPLGLYRGLVLDIDFQMHSQLYLGLWERETYPWLRRGMRHCQWAVDVGAGIGELTACLLKKTGAVVFAIEPNAESRDALWRNVALNGFRGSHRLTVIDKCAGRAAGDQALDDLPINRVRRGLIKIDVDGAELAVLDSADRMLTDGAGSIDVLVETHSRELERDCLAFFRARDYTCTVIPNAWWRIVVPEQRPIEHNRWLWATRKPARR